VKKSKRLKQNLIKKSKIKDCESITISHLDIYASIRKTVRAKSSKYMESKKVYNRKNKSWKKGIV